MNNRTNINKLIYGNNSYHTAQYYSMAHSYVYSVYSPTQFMIKSTEFKFPLEY